MRAQLRLKGLEHSAQKRQRPGGIRPRNRPRNQLTRKLHKTTAEINDQPDEPGSSVPVKKTVTMGPEIKIGQMGQGRFAS